MSEYQYYEFAAVDRPLDGRELDTLRGLSTRAHITPTSFVNSYEWGSFKSDPRTLVERYFDAFLYLANWGTRELILRLPARLVDPEVVQRYCSGDAVSAWNTDDHVVVAAVSEEEEGDFEWGGEGVLASILPVRAELLAGDLRALYLLWLLRVQVGEVLDSEADFVAAQQIRATRSARDGETRRYLLSGLVRCAMCGRRLDSHWVHGRAGYRCRHGHTSACPPSLDEPKAVYVREDRLIHELADRLSSDHGDAASTVAALRSSESLIWHDGTMWFLTPG